MENNQEKKTQEDMVKEAVEEARKISGQEAEEAKNADSEVVIEDAAANNGAGPGDIEQAEAQDALEEEPEVACEGGQKVQAEKKEKRFGKRNKKDQKDEKIEELTDKLARQMAEFDNFRKRTEKEKTQMYEIGAKDIIDKILPVVDNFERGLAAAEEKKEDPFIQGMDKVYKQLMTTLEEAGVQPIDAVGNEFNPDFHNAVMHVEDENLGENIIAEEFQKGYMYRDSVVRHSMVKVAN